MPILATYQEGIRVFEQRGRASVAEGSKDPITKVFYAIDQNGGGPLGSIRETITWMEDQIWTYEYLGSEEFCGTLTGPLHYLLGDLDQFKEALEEPDPEEMYDEEDAEASQSTDLTQDPGVELGSPQDQDMGPVLPDPGVGLGSPTDQDMNSRRNVELGSPWTPT